MTLVEIAIAIPAGLALAFLVSRLAGWAVRRALGPDADPQAHLTRIHIYRMPRR